VNLKDLSLKDVVKIGVAVTATLLIALTLNIAISFNNTTVINNYVKQTEKNFEEVQQENLELKADIAQANATLKQVQGNVSKIKSVQSQELAIQKEILNQVD
jgi:predicted RNase H-like nuclease (RuvC/YqgF family)